MAENLIILGKGATADTYPEYRAAYPHAALWTLNNAWHPDSRLHFDVHYDQRFWTVLDAHPGTPSVVSPYREREESHSFDLATLYFAFGNAYLESTICYMAAHAALLQHHGLRRFASLSLPGCDMADAYHFAYRFGLHYWLGVLQGQGTQIDLPAGSYCLQRKASIAVGATETCFPHIYGQPRSCTLPDARRFNWWEGPMAPE